MEFLTKEQQIAFVQREFLRLVSEKHKRKEIAHQLPVMLVEINKMMIIQLVNSNLIFFFSNYINKKNRF